MRHATQGHGESSLITLGSTGDRVAILERVLGQPVDGVMDYDDVRALISFQQHHEGLVPDGICGPRSWQCVAKYYNDLIAEDKEE